MFDKPFINDWWFGTAVAVYVLSLLPAVVGRVSLVSAMIGAAVNVAFVLLVLLVCRFAWRKVLHREQA